MLQYCQVPKGYFCMTYFLGNSSCDLVMCWCLRVEFWILRNIFYDVFITFFWPIFFLFSLCFEQVNENIKKITKKYYVIFKIQHSNISQGFLLCQSWIVNYYVKCLSNNLSIENMNTDFQRNYISKLVHFGILIHILSCNIYFRLLRRKNELKINNLIDVVENKFGVTVMMYQRFMIF